MAPTPARAEAAARIAGLDGLRGVAILLVVVLHAAGPVFELPRVVGIAPVPFDLALARCAGFGWVGVDLFFVLSGFLITGILLQNKAAPGCIRTFYARRVLRIFPLYYVVVAAALWLLPHLAPRLAVADRSATETASYLLYLANVWQAANPEQYLRDPVLGVTWSLAIEEQFYLLWPALVVFLPRRALVAVLVGILAAAPALRLWLRLEDVHWWAVYVLTPCRLDGLALGALLALFAARDAAGGRAPAGRRRALLPWGLLGGGAAAAAVVIAVEGTPAYGFWMQTVGYSAVAAAAAGALLLAVRPGPVARLLSGRLLRLFGKHSYAIYLLHFPVVLGLGSLAVGAGAEWALAPLVRATGSYAPALVLFIAAVAGVALLVGIASWHLLERRCLELKRLFPARPLAVAPADPAPTTPPAAVAPAPPSAAALVNDPAAARAGAGSPPPPTAPSDR